MCFSLFTTGGAFLVARGALTRCVIDERGERRHTHKCMQVGSLMLLLLPRGRYCVVDRNKCTCRWTHYSSTFK